MKSIILWHVIIRPKGIGTGSDSEPLSVQRIGLVKDPSRMPFWCATWFTKVTDKRGNSQLGKDYNVSTVLFTKATNKPEVNIKTMQSC